MSATETNPFLVRGIDQAIDEAAGKDVLSIQLSEEMWAGFKGSVPRKDRRQREGSRFVNAYRGIPISIHPEWEWGWRLLIADEAPVEVEG